MKVQRLFPRLVLLVLVLSLVGIGYLYRDQLGVGELQQRLDALGAFAPLVFMLLYTVATVAFMPGLIFTIAGGVLFGPVFGTLYSLTGATLGATLAFLVARYLASDWVASRAGGRLDRMISGVEREGWRFVAFTRLVPVFPFNLLNYALGLTRIPLLHYVLATYVCMLPGAFAYTWIGHAGAETVAGGRSGIQAVLIGIGLLAAVIFLPRLVRRFRHDFPADDSEVSR
jgi:uncharacterized membrane protein YdjX (TVP38/TMEM64 family)